MKKIIFLCPVLLLCYHANAQDKVINLRLEQPDKVIVKPKIIELDLVQPDEKWTQDSVFLNFREDLVLTEPSFKINSLILNEVEMQFLGFTSDITLDIFDIWGNFLKTEKITNPSDNLSYKATLPKTISKAYIIKATSKEHQFSQKIITK